MFICFQPVSAYYLPPSLLGGKARAIHNPMQQPSLASTSEGSIHVCEISARRQGRDSEVRLFSVCIRLIVHIEPRSIIVRLKTAV